MKCNKKLVESKLVNHELIIGYAYGNPGKVKSKNTVNRKKLEKLDDSLLRLPILKALMHNGENSMYFYCYLII